jgi:uncharacterized protein (TIGR00299 family) protein
VSRLAYVDCVGGVAGDMLLGALLDGGADADFVRSGLARLGIEGLELGVGRARRGPLDAARVEVAAPPDQPHRGPREVRELIEGARLPPRARERALATFDRLAVAEGRVHGIAPEEVTFHEVGAADAVADVCGVALALESLGVERIACSPLPVARGVVASAHGPLPLPAPATLALLEGAPLHGVEGDEELVTPTGAALVAALAEGFGPLPALRLEATGYGAGARELGRVPNVVRVLVGEAQEVAARGPTRAVSLVETNLDDLPPELVPDAAQSATAAGALDVWTTQAGMKKGRPGVVVSALVRPEREGAVAEALLRSTTALGVRVARLERVELEREWRTVEIAGEPVRIKLGRLDGEVVNVAPEHDDCARAAERTGRPTVSIWSAAVAAGERWLAEGKRA